MQDGQLYRYCGDRSDRVTVGRLSSVAIAGMMLITATIALPVTYLANRFHVFNRYIGAAAGVLSLLLGFFLVHQIGFSDSLFR